MYTRCPDDRRSQPNPPENYAGTFINTQNDCQNERPEPPCQPRFEFDDQFQDNCQPPCQPSDELPCRPEPPCPSDHRDEHRRGKHDDKGILGGLLGRFGNFDLDDLLLLGLIFLLANGRGDSDNSDDLLLILGLLFFMGF